MMSIGPTQSAIRQAFRLWGCASLLWIAGTAAQASDDAVRLVRRDLNDDGKDEWILSNRYLQVEVMTGEEPQAPPPGFRDRFLGRERESPRSMYGTRFVGPGWIRNVTFVPTGRRWFINDRRPGGQWHGIPEEFDQAVRMVEVAPGVWHCLKIGVGVCKGRGWCTRGTLSLIDPGVWRETVEQLADGAVAVVFTQEMDTQYGYAYTYTKRIELRPGESRFNTTRTLHNRGEKPLRTTWYTHGFWGPAERGDTYDETCWVTIPIRSLVPGDATPVNTEPCVVSKRHPAYYWGVLDGDAVAGAWYACGQSLTQEIFVSRFSRQPDFYRIWSHSDTFSCEPFQVIDLSPGASVTWDDVRGCGRGLSRVDGQDGLAAYALSRSAAGGAAAARLTVAGVPFVSLSHGRLAVAAAGHDGTKQRRTYDLSDLSPERPFFVELEPSYSEVDRLTLELSGTGDTIQIADAGPATVPTARSWPSAWPRVEGGAAALIFAELKRDAEGGLIADRAVSYLTDYLLKAGFAVTLAHPRENWYSVDLSQTDVVIFSGLGALTPEKVTDLEEYVDTGGGLLVCAPLPPRPLEFSSLLPIEGTAATVSAALSPRDCTREFLGASAQRYHLRRVTEHPTVAGLPLFPEAYQDIARLHVVRARDNATVVLRYAAVEGLLPSVDAPALVTADRGEGRVAVLTCPVDWGLPASWCIWSRVGEYHRTFFVQIALWLSQ